MATNVDARSIALQMKLPEREGSLPRGAVQSLKIGCDSPCRSDLRSFHPKVTKAGSIHPSSSASKPAPVPLIYNASRGISRGEMLDRRGIVIAEPYASYGLVALNNVRLNYLTRSPPSERAPRIYPSIRLLVGRLRVRQWYSSASGRPTPHDPAALRRNAGGRG